MLPPTPRGTPRFTNLADHAARVIGKDEVDSVLRYAKPEEEQDFSMALLRTRNPQALIAAIRSVPANARLAACRVIAHHGLPAFRRAFRITEEAKLPPSEYLHSTAYALTQKTGGLAQVHAVPPIGGIATPAHQAQLQEFLRLPAAYRSKVARGAMLYRDAYRSVYRLVSEGSVDTPALRLGLNESAQH